MIGVLQKWNRIQSAINLTFLSNDDREILSLGPVLLRIEESRAESFSIPLPVSSLLNITEELYLAFTTVNLFTFINSDYLRVIDESFSDCGYINEILSLQSNLRSILTTDSTSLGPYIRSSLQTPNDQLWVSNTSFFSDDIFDGIPQELVNSLQRRYNELTSANISFRINSGRNFYNFTLTCFYFALRDVYYSNLSLNNNLIFCTLISKRILERICSRLDTFAHHGSFYYFIQECFLVCGLIISVFSSADISQTLIFTRGNNREMHQCIFSNFELLLLSGPCRGQIATEIDICQLFLRIYNVDGRTNIPISGMIVECLSSQNILGSHQQCFIEIWGDWFRYCQTRINSFIRTHSLIQSPNALISVRASSSLSAGAALSALVSLESLTDEQRLNLLSNALLRASERTNLAVLSSIFGRFGCQDSAINLVCSFLEEFNRVHLESSISSHMNSFHSVIRYLPFCEREFTSFSSVYLMSMQFLSFFDEGRMIDELWNSLLCLFNRSSIFSLLLTEQLKLFWLRILSDHSNQLVQHYARYEGFSSSTTIHDERIDHGRLTHPTSLGQLFVRFHFSTIPPPIGHISLLEILKLIINALDCQNRYQNEINSFRVSRAGLEILQLRPFFLRMEESHSESFSLIIPVSSLLTLVGEICLSFAMPGVFELEQPETSNRINEFLRVCGLSRTRHQEYILCLQSHLRGILNTELSSLGPYIHSSLQAPDDPFSCSILNFLSANMFNNVSNSFVNFVLTSYEDVMSAYQLDRIIGLYHGRFSYNLMFFCFISALVRASRSVNFPISFAYFCRIMFRKVMSNITWRIDLFARPGFFSCFIRECFIISGLIIGLFSDNNNHDIWGWSIGSSESFYLLNLPFFEVALLQRHAQFFSSEDECSMCHLFLRVYNEEGRIANADLDVPFDRDVHQMLRPNFAAVWKPWFRYCERRIRSFLSFQEELIASTDLLIRFRTISSLSVGSSISLLSSGMLLTDSQRVELLRNALLSDRCLPCGRNCLDWTLLSCLFDKFSCSNSAIVLLIEQLSIVLKVGGTEALKLAFRYLPFCESSFIDFCSVLLASRDALELIDNFENGVYEQTALLRNLNCLFARSTVSYIFLSMDIDELLERAFRFRDRRDVVSSRRRERPFSQDSDPDEGPSTRRARHFSPDSDPDEGPSTRRERPFSQDSDPYEGPSIRRGRPFFQYSDSDSD